MSKVSKLSIALVGSHLLRDKAKVIPWYVLFLRGFALLFWEVLSYWKTQESSSWLKVLLSNSVERCNYKSTILGKDFLIGSQLI